MLNKQRMLDNMDKVERPVLERRKMALAFRPHLRGHKAFRPRPEALRRRLWS